MRFLFFSFAIFMFATIPVTAQTAFEMADMGKEGEVLAAPICGKLVNRSDQTIMGEISTAPQILPSGISAKHRDNFRLKSGEEKEICAAGPFYEGRRLQLVIRTLIPLFDCKTQIDGIVYLDSEPQEAGFRKLSATCK